MKKPIVALLSLFVAIALGEGGLRLAWHNPYANESARPVLFLRLHPAGTDHRYDRSRIGEETPEVRFRTDERSYLVPSRRDGTPDATLLFLGGSTTECAVVHEELRFPALVATLLAARGLRVDSLNAAHAGNTVHDSLNVLLNHAIADRPDIVVMMHAANDAGLLARSGGYEERMARSPTAADVARWVGQNASSRLHVFAFLRRATTTPPVARPRPRARPLDPRAALADLDGFRSRVRAFVALARALGVEPVLLTQPLAAFRTEFTPVWVNVEVQPAYNDVVREVGEESGTTVIDLARDVAEQVADWDRPNVVFYDGMHVNDAGSELYARLIADGLEASVVAARAGGRRQSLSR